MVDRGAIVGQLRMSQNPWGQLRMSQNPWGELRQRGQRVCANLKGRFFLLLKSVRVTKKKNYKIVSLRVVI